MRQNVLFLVVIASVVGFQSGAAALPARPNIPHIHADDHRPDGLRALGNSVLQTPNLALLDQSEASGRSRPERSTSIP